MSGGRLEGKRAIITGAGMGMGQAAAIRFAREGAKVGLIDNNEAAVSDTARAIAAEGGAALALVADVAVEAPVAAAVTPATNAVTRGFRANRLKTGAARTTAR